MEKAASLLERIRLSSKGLNGMCLPTGSIGSVYSRLSRSSRPLALTTSGFPLAAKLVAPMAMATISTTSTTLESLIRKALGQQSGAQKRN